MAYILKSKDHIFVGTIVSACVAMLLATIVEPLGGDNAIYHSMAFDLLRHSKIPYLGSWDQNFPGIVYLHAGSIALLGPSAIAFRAFDAAIQLAFALFYYYFLQRFVSPRTAAIAAILYIAYYVSAGPDVYGKQDAYGMMAIFVATSLVFFRPNNNFPRLPHIVSSGLLCGIAVIMRPTFLLEISIIVIFLLLNSTSVRDKYISCILFGSLALAIPGSIVLYYLTIPAGGRALFESTILYNLDIYASLHSGAKVSWEFGRSGAILVLALVALRKKAISSSIRFRFDIKYKLLYASFLVASIAVVVIMGKYFRYHLTPFFMLLIPLAAVGISSLGEEVPPRWRTVSIAGLITCCSFVAYNPIAPIAFMWGLFSKGNALERVRFARDSDTLAGALAEQKTLRYLSMAKNARGSVEICAFAPFLRYDLQQTREIAGRYVSFHSLAFKAGGLQTGYYTSYQLRWQREYLDTLRAAQPRFIIIARNMPFWYIKDIYDDCLHYLPGFDSLLTASYRYDTAFGGYQIYKRNSE